jgi:hypothetical protein
VVIPVMFRRYFSKYPNVYISPNLNLLLGDLKPSLESQKAGKAFYANSIASASILKAFDMRVCIDGISPTILFTSPAAIKEFCDSQPHAIDRVFEDKAFGKLFQKGIVHMPSYEEFKERK